MYWPIGAPRIYAASGNKVDGDRVLLFDDETESPEKLEGSDPPADVLGTISEAAEDDTESHSGALTPGRPTTPGIKSVEHHEQRRLSARTLAGLADKLKDVHAKAEKEEILALAVSRTGHMFAVITSTSMTIWQTKPTAILAVVVRSPTSLKTYGPNVTLMIRPDSAIFVVQTILGYLITYSLASDPDARVYRPHFPENSSVHTRRQSNFTGARIQGDRILWGAGEGGGIREVSVRFRMVIKVDAGIEKALTLEEELVVATQKPALIQCIRWTPDSTGSQTRTEHLSKMSWLPKKTNVLDMIYDRPMNLFAWITSDGKAFAVQRIVDNVEPKKPKEGENSDDADAAKKLDATKKLFRGYCFHDPDSNDQLAVKAAINSRFSLIAVGCSDGDIHVYTARDYVGNIPLSHKQKLSVSAKSSGKLTFLSYSPDGYCLFAGYEHGWATWSVFGKAGGTSFTANRSISEENDEGWLDGVKGGAWIGGGSEILLISRNDDRIWSLEMARSAVTGCFTASNLSRTMLLTRSGIMVYRGYDLPDLSTISAESSLWHTAQVPPSYLMDQWPIRCAVISSDGRYVAVAGRRGLAHYSVASGRWKTFISENMETEFLIRGGMCWHRHILVAAVEAGDSYEIRLFSREAALDSNLMLYSEQLPTAVVMMALSGDDSLLVYTYENLLYHYIFSTRTGSVALIQVGRIAFNGIVRSPARVRGLSWILPDSQLQDGDPSQDVAVATVLFLVDGKLVLLQPSLNDQKNLKYDMRVIAQNVEYYSLMRDHPFANTPMQDQIAFPSPEGISKGSGQPVLRDSLWTFDGNEVKSWPKVPDVLLSVSSELASQIPPTVPVTVDFYPLSILLSKGIFLGVEPDLIQRRDINFSFFRFAIRTHLFLPELLRFHLSHHDTPAALQLAQQYQHLEYFPHALEILLHNVLDEEVDTAPQPEAALLPRVLSFLSSFPQYLDIVVQCTRKTEVRSWRTLFSYLPPAAELFEESLQRGSLKTAGGYLLVLHTFEELSSSSEQLVRLLARAKNEADWELCKELARFLTALDESGATLREALEMVDLRSPVEESANGSFLFEGSRLKVPRNGGGRSGDSSAGMSRRSSSGSRSPTHPPSIGKSTTQKTETDKLSAPI